MRCAVWYHLHNLKNMEKTHGRMLVLVKLQPEACNFTKTNTLPWVLFTFLDCTNGTKSCNASQMELNEIQTNPYLRSKSNSGDKFLQEFYAKYLKVSANFPNVINHAKKICFADTYMC